MKSLIILGGILGAYAYIPLWKPLLKKVAEQNFLTWALWAILDAIATLSILFQSGNFLLAAIFTLGSIVTAIIVLRSSNKPDWTWFEIMIIVMIIICLTVWHRSGSRTATIASTTALLLASIPQLGDVWRNPQKTPTLPYVIWSLANFVTIWGGKNWSVEERLYPVSALIICICITTISLRNIEVAPEGSVLPR